MRGETLIIDAPDRGRIGIVDILTADNVMSLLSDNEIQRIGSRCKEDFDLDLGSRKDWNERYQRWLDIAMQVRKAKTFPWPGAANIKFPLLTTASIQFQARAYPAIVDGSNLVKGRVLGPDDGVPLLDEQQQPIMNPQAGEPMWLTPPGAKRARADRMGNHMTWQLLYDMPSWEEDTDRLLLMLPIVGCTFRKTYYDQVEGRNVSEMIPADDFVVNYWAKSLLTAPRFTHILRRYPYQVEENVRNGLWADVMLPEAHNDRDESETAPVEFLEQHCRIDLDGDGYPEPYVVTMTRENGEVCRIVPCFGPREIVVSSPQFEGTKKLADIMQGDRVPNVELDVVKIEQRQYFVKYSFIPSPDGSFYDIGFGQLLDDLTAAIDTIVNQSLDAGTLQNAQGGFIGSGLDMKSGNLKFVLGEWKRVNVTGGTLRENLVPLNLPGPSAVLITLLEMLIGAAKEITSVQDILTGAGVGQNTPATTVLAQIEQATKVMTGIFKRIHRAFGQELRQLRALNRDFLDEKQYFNLADESGAIGREDYQDDDLDVVPVSDPTMVNDAQKAAKAQVLMQFNGDPMVNQLEIRRRVFESTGQPDIAKLLEVPAPPPDPKVLIEGAKLALEKMKIQQSAAAQDDKDKAAAVNTLMQAATAAASIGLLHDAALFAGEAQKLATEISGYSMESTNEQTDGPGAVPGMAGPSPDAGIPPVPPGQAGQADGGMGAGPIHGPDAATNGDGLVAAA